MIILDCEQQSPEWFAARCGIPSASHFDCIVTARGEPSKSAQGYMYRLAYERITGLPHDTFMSYDMKRGIENESVARSLYGFIRDVEVKQVGLCYFDERKLYSSSPDGLVGDEGGLEIKDAKPEVQIDRLLNGWPESNHLQQIQGNLFITGRKWWDRMSHCPGLPPLIDRYHRDDSFCAKLRVALDEFCAELDRIEEKLRKII